MTFAEFLDVMHQHSKQEKIPKEIIQAFRGHDTARRGMIPARNLKHILLRWGECLSPREGEYGARSSGVQLTVTEVKIMH